MNPRQAEEYFCIAATDNPAAIIAPDLIPLIKRQAPQIKVAFTLPDKARIADHLEQGELDLFVGTAEDAAGGLVGQTLFDDEFVTAQRRDHPRGKRDMTIDEFCQMDHLLISTADGHFSGMIDNALAEIGRERRVSVSIQSYALAPLVLASTDCICTLPRRFLERFDQILDFFKAPLPLSTFGMQMFWHPRMRTDPAHGWLRQMVLQVARSTRS